MVWKLAYLGEAIALEKTLGTSIGAQNIGTR